MFYIDSYRYINMYESTITINHSLFERFKLMTVVISISITWECTIRKSGFTYAYISISYGLTSTRGFIERVWEREASGVYLQQELQRNDVLTRLVDSVN